MMLPDPSFMVLSGNQIIGKPENQCKSCDGVMLLRDYGILGLYIGLVKPVKGHWCPVCRTFTVKK